MENKKVLFVATVTSHINAFHKPYLKWFKEQGYEVHVASNGDEKIENCDKHFNLKFSRNPLKIQNIKQYKPLKKIIEKENYEIVHCHTPIASVLTRLAAKKARKNGTKVIYTAHGFHFYKGAPILNWLIYYPIEKWMSKYTDILITINNEDYELAKRKFKAKRIKLINGVGFDNTKFDIEITEVELNELRKKIGISKDKKILTYVAELNKNKNQMLLIRAIQEINKDSNNDYVLLLVGDGKLKNYYQDYIEKNNLQKNIKLLGRRNDILQILKLTDIYVASSLREGLPLNILEAMYMGLPIIATDNRGHRELIEHKINGFIIKNFSNELIENIDLIVKNNTEKIIQNNRKIVEKYLLRNIIIEMKKIYLTGEM